VINAILRGISRNERTSSREYRHCWKLKRLFMKNIVTIEILLAISLFASSAREPNAGPSKALFTDAEVDAFVTREDQREQTISCYDITKLNCLAFSRMNADRLMFQHYPTLLSMDWFRISNQLEVANQLPTTKYHRYESDHPHKEAHY
jgi:hypothetical protein